VKPAGALVLGVAAIGLSACGASPHRSYSIPQVTSAFAAHDISLRPTRRRTTGGVVVLVGRGGVKVLVYLRRQNAAFGWTGERPILRGNLIVFRPAAEANAVDGALRDLR
jgi:hypothetical protein